MVSPPESGVAGDSVNLSFTVMVSAGSVAQTSRSAGVRGSRSSFAPAWTGDADGVEVGLARDDGGGQGGEALAV
ncbi:hypothetical protein CLV40_116139 [Actinokineospora auranticolor]|uniref:Uncharacterized protein n=1 Tax=Actinokineospora auranticolor TaxID=155976 RepID=A0A2S6GIW7_9PSEU|nr:hypothetical protein CLV40_116139 [Actinokineospora auranticolor]